MFGCFFLSSLFVAASTFGSFFPPTPHQLLWLFCDPLPSHGGINWAWRRNAIYLWNPKCMSSTCSFCRIFNDYSEQQLMDNNSFELLWVTAHAPRLSALVKPFLEKRGPQGLEPWGVMWFGWGHKCKLFPSHFWLGFLHSKKKLCSDVPIALHKQSVRRAAKIQLEARVRWKKDLAGAIKCLVGGIGCIKHCLEDPLTKYKGPTPKRIGFIPV